MSSFYQDVTYGLIHELLVEETKLRTLSLLDQADQIANQRICLQRLQEIRDTLLLMAGLEDLSSVSAASLS